MDREIRSGSASRSSVVWRVHFIGAPGGADGRAAGPARGLRRPGVRDLDGPGRRGACPQAVQGVEAVVEDAAQVAVGAVGEDGHHDRTRVHPGCPGGDEGDGAGAPAATDEVVPGEPAAAVGGLGRADPVHLVEPVVGDVAGMDAAAQTAHEPGAGGLAEDRGAGGVHADQPERGPLPAQSGGDPGAVAAGADAAHQHVDAVEPADDLGGERGVTGRVVGVVVLVGPVRARQRGQQLAEPGEPCRLPAAPVRGPVDELQPGSVGAQQLPHGRFEFGIAHQDDGVAERLAREGQPDAERAGRGLHDRCAGQEFTAFLSSLKHRHGGACLHAAHPEAFELGPEAGVRTGQGRGDTGERGAPDQAEQFAVAGGAQKCGGHRLPPYWWMVPGPPSSQKKGYGSADTAVTPEPMNRGSTALPVWANITSGLPCRRAWVLNCSKLPLPSVIPEARTASHPASGPDASLRTGSSHSVVPPLRSQGTQRSPRSRSASRSELTTPTTSTVRPGGRSSRPTTARALARDFSREPLRAAAAAGRPRQGHGAGRA